MKKSTIVLLAFSLLTVSLLAKGRIDNTLSVQDAIELYEDDDVEKGSEEIVIEKNKITRCT